MRSSYMIRAYIGGGSPAFRVSEGGIVFARCILCIGASIFENCMPFHCWRCAAARERASVDAYRECRTRAKDQRTQIWCRLPEATRASCTVVSGSGSRCTVSYRVRSSLISAPEVIASLLVHFTTGAQLHLTTGLNTELSIQEQAYRAKAFPPGTRPVSVLEAGSSDHPGSASSEALGCTKTGTGFA